VEWSPIMIPFLEEYEALVPQPKDYNLGAPSWPQVSAKSSPTASFGAPVWATLTKVLGDLELRAEYEKMMGASSTP